MCRGERKDPRGAVVPPRQAQNGSSKAWAARMSQLCDCGRGVKESCTGAVPSAAQPLQAPLWTSHWQGRWRKTEVDTGDVPCQGLTCHTQAIGHTTREGKGIISKTWNRSTKSWAVSPESGATEPTVGERLAATGNEGGGSREAAGGWRQGRKVESRAEALNVSCTGESPGSF